MFLLRFLCAIIPFTCLQSFISDYEQSNKYIALFMASSYLIELRLYNFYLIKRAGAILLKNHQLYSTIASLWVIGLFYYSSMADSLREQPDIVCEAAITVLLVATLL